MKQIMKNKSYLFDGYSGLENKFKWVGVNIFKMKYTVGIFYCLNEKLYTFKIIVFICQLMRSKTVLSVIFNLTIDRLTELYKCLSTSFLAL